MTTSYQLAAKIEAQNKSAAIANRLRPAYVEAIKPFIGKRTHKADGSGMFEKVKAALKTAAQAEFGGEIDAQIWSPHQGCFSIKTFKHYAEFTVVYAETYFYAWTTNNAGIAEEIGHNWEPLRDDWTVEEVLEVKARLETLRDQVRQLESGISPFSNIY